MNANRRVRHRRHANPFTVRGPIEIPDFSKLYGREAPVALDVGFGRGAFLLELGRVHPEWNVLGLEIRQHLVDAINTTAESEGLRHVRALLANASFHLGDLVPPRSIAFVSINFPDPWYKKRHQKRRVVDNDWLDLLRTKLKDGAEIHAMSDYEPIAVEMRTFLESHRCFENVDGTGYFANDSTTGITTEREIKHLGRGDAVYRMRFCFHRDAVGGC